MRIFPMFKKVSAGAAAFADAFSLGITFSEAAGAQADSAAFAIALAQADSNAPQSETVSLRFPAPDFADTSTAPADADSFTLRVWLSGTTMDSTNGVTSPGSADGQNDAVNAVYSSALAGDANPRTHSALGANVPTATITAALLRGWFKSANTLATSTTTLVMHSTTGAFADITMFTNAALNATVDHSTGDFTFDLLAAGVNTLAKLQSCQLLCSTKDAAAGVTPAVLSLDAAALEIAGAFQ